MIISSFVSFLANRIVVQEEQFIIVASLLFTGDLFPPSSKFSIFFVEAVVHQKENSEFLFQEQEKRKEQITVLWWFFRVAQELIDQIWNDIFGSIVPRLYSVRLSENFNRFARRTCLKLARAYFIN